MTLPSSETHPQRASSPVPQCADGHTEAIGGLRGRSQILKIQSNHLSCTPCHPLGAPTPSAGPGTPRQECAPPHTDTHTSSWGGHHVLPPEPPKGFWPAARPTTFCSAYSRVKEAELPGLQAGRGALKWFLITRTTAGVGVGEPEQVTASGHVLAPARSPQDKLPWRYTSSLKAQSQTLPVSQPKPPNLSSCPRPCQA